MLRGVERERRMVRTERGLMVEGFMVKYFSMADRGKEISF